MTGKRKASRNAKADVRTSRLQSTASRLAALQRMTVAELRGKYAEVFGEETRSRHKRHLIRRIAWRLQANEEGDLSERARRRAAELAADSDVRMTPPPPNAKAADGRAKVGNISISQDGSDTAALDAIKQEVDVNAVTGQLPDEYMRDIDIVRYDCAGQETRRWTLHGAWIKVLEYDDLEGADTENGIEKLSVCYQYWTQ